MTHPVPENEAERLRALHGLRMQDAPPLSALDSICALARQQLRVRAALVSLVDRDAQLFVARSGIDLARSSRDFAFCSHAILQDEVLVIEDAREDARFRDNPLVTGEPHIGFYAGAPLILHPGIRLGTLCVIDQEPRRFGRDERNTLELLAEIAADSMRQREASLLAQKHGRDLGWQQAALAQSQDIAAVGLWEWDLRTGRNRWSEGLFRLLGCEPGDVEPSIPTFLDFVHPEDRAAVHVACNRTREGRPFDMKFRIVRRDGEVRTLVDRGDVANDVHGRPLHAVGMARDVTESDQGKAALRASEARWRHAIEAGSMIAFEIDPDTGFTTFSKHAHEIAGLESGNLDDLLARVHAQDRAAVEQAIRNTMQDGSPLQIEFRYVNPDGRVVWLSGAGGLTGGGGNGPRRVSGVCFDVTARKALESSLLESESRFRDFAEVSSDWLWETDDEFRFTSIRGNTDSAGRPLADFIGMTRWEMAGADTGTRPWKEHIEDHRARRPYRNFAYTILQPSGELSHIVTNGRPFFDPEGRFLGYRGTASDHTAHKALETQLQQAQKMEAVGHLTGGVAHDFNNLLTIIMGNAEILVEELAPDPELQSLAKLVGEAAENGADLISRLLTFARRQTLAPAAVSVNAVVEGVASMLRRTISEQVVLRTQLAQDTALAFADSSQLATGILNLVVNARDAMPKGGTLTIATSNIVVPERSVELEAGRYVGIRVTDTGSGMAPDVLCRVLEPFFTTKEVGKGTGLGLPMVYGFAKQSGGHLAIASEPGLGTTVLLVLPQVEGANAGKSADKDVAVQSGAERILVVEDRTDVRRFVLGHLAKLGYHTQDAPDGPAALELLRSDAPFDLLFTDIVLPEGMSGLELADAARQIRPDLKVLFTSGYSEDVLRQQGAADPAFLLLRKPYKRQELAAMLRKALDGSAPGGACGMQSPDPQSAGMAG
jgi:PAS domain S-box-containing protein